MMLISIRDFRIRKGESVVKCGAETKDIYYRGDLDCEVMMGVYLENHESVQVAQVRLLRALENLDVKLRIQQGESYADQTEE